MRVWNRLPLAGKLLLPICAALVIGLAASTYIVAAQSARETQKLSMSLGRAAADQAATEIALRFETAFRLTRVLAQQATTIEREKASRDPLLRIVLDTTRTAPDVVGAWTTFSPDAVDGAAPHVREASGELALQSEALRREVDTFIARVGEG